MAAMIMQRVRGLLHGDAAARLTTAMPLMAAGLTSTLAVQLVGALEDALGAELPGTLVFDYPSVTEMAAFICESGLAPALPAAPAQVAARALAAAPTPALHQQAQLAVRAPCVITAAAHCVPGGQLKYSVGAPDRISVVPLERWDTELAPTDVPTGALHVLPPQAWLLLLSCGAHCSCRGGAHALPHRRAEPAVRRVRGWRRPI